MTRELRTVMSERLCRSQGRCEAGLPADHGGGGRLGSSAAWECRGEGGESAGTRGTAGLGLRSPGPGGHPTPQRLLRPGRGTGETGAARASPGIGWRVPANGSRRATPKTRVHVSGGDDGNVHYITIIS